MHSMAAMMVSAFSCDAASAATSLPVTLENSAPQTVNFCEDIIFDLKVRNISNQTVSIPWGTKALLDVIIHNRRGNVPPLTPGFSLWPDRVPYIPLGQKRFSIFIRNPLDQYDLGSGKYFVKLRYPLEPSGSTNSNVKMVESNEIMIAVLPRESRKPK
jgi:hypothetical protein